MPPPESPGFLSRLRTHSRAHVLQGVTQQSIAVFSLLSASIEVEKLLFRAVSRLELLFLSLWLLTLRAQEVQLECVLKRKPP